MKSKNDISHIRQLLDKWYDGSASPAEVDLLVEFFSSDDVPAELEQDAEMFRLMNEADAEINEELLDVDLQMPDLVAEVNEAVNAENESPKKKFSPRLAWWTAGTLAVAASLALVVINRQTPVSESTQISRPAATQELVADAETPAEVPDTHEISEIVKPENSAPIHRAQVKTRKKAEPQPVESVYDDELTDPQQVYELMAMIDKKLATTFAAAGQAVTGSSEVLDDTFELINKKLDIL